MGGKTNSEAVRTVRGLVGNRIRSLRKERKLTQADLAEAVDLDRTYIVGIEKGRRNVSLDNLTRLSIGLDVSLSELFDGVDACVTESA